MSGFPSISMNSCSGTLAIEGIVKARLRIWKSIHCQLGLYNADTIDLALTSMCDLPTMQ